MVGQEKLIQLIDSLHLDTFPRSVLLLGDRGAGKHSLVSYISAHLSLPVEDITDSLELTTIDRINLAVSPSIYTINSNSISVKEQNVILKFLEEPFKSAYIIILCENKNILLQTILNRCQVWELARYSNDLLMKFFPATSSMQPDVLLSICNTPGKMIEFQDAKAQDTYMLASKIVDCIGEASLANTLTLSNKVNFDKDFDKLIFNLLVDCLIYKTMTAAIKDSKYAPAYFITNKLANDRFVPGTNKKHLFEHYLCDLRAFMRGVR